MKKSKIFLIILIISILTIVGVLGFTYLLLTGPFGPPKHMSMSIVVYSNSPVIDETLTNVTVMIPMIYIKNKPFYSYVNIKGWDYEVVKTKYGEMLRLHTNKLLGDKVVCNVRIVDVPVVEINKEVRITPSYVANESVVGTHPIIRTVNYTVPIYTSHNLTVVISMSVCSGISLFEPIYDGMKYCGCRVDRIVASGRGWIHGNGTTKIEMYPRKHWYDL